MLTEKKLDNKEYGRELIDYIVYKTYGFNPKAPSKKKTSGTGFALKDKLTQNVMRGRGLDENDEFSNALNDKIDQFELKRDIPKQNEGDFGKYNVRVNDLKRGFFNIRYPSGAVIKPFPKQLISTSLRNIIVQIINEKKLSEEEYETLEDSEKKLFEYLITFAKLDKVENINFLNTNDIMMKREMLI